MSLVQFTAPWRTRLQNAPVAFGAALAVVVWGTLGYVLLLEKHHAEVGAQRSAAALATLFAESAGRAIREVDKSLLVLRALYEDSPGEFAAAAYSKRSSQFDSMIFQMAIIGADGYLVTSNVQPPTERLDLSDRDHFKVHKNRIDDKLYISAPLLGRASGRWAIQFTRGVRGPDGHFGGVIVASADPDHFSSLYESVDLGPDGVVGLFRANGVVLSRRGQKTNSTGVSIAGTPLFDIIRNGTDGLYAAASPIDGIERIGAYRRVAGHDLVVAVGLSSRDIYAPFARRAALLTLLGVLASGLIVGAVVLSLRMRQKSAALAKAGDVAAAQTAELALRDHREELARRDAAVLAGVETLSRRLARSIAALGALIHTIGDQCSRMNEAAAAARRGSAGAAAIANTSAYNVDQIAGSAITISDVGIQTERAVNGALTTLEQSIAETERSRDAFNDLIVATQQIDRVVQLIRTVAHQTNMLALNATIEAARAGEAGRGFSVVAQEIKSLAAQTATATTEISAQISAIQTAGQISIDSVRAVQERLRLTRDTTVEIVDAVAQQSYSASEIAMSIATASQTAADSSRSAQAIREAAELSDACAADVLATSRLLESEAHTIRVEIEALHQSLKTGSAAA